MRILILLLAFCSFSYGQNEKIEVEGVVTYFHNSNLGNKADIGSKVYFRPAKYSDTLNKDFSRLRYFEVVVNTNKMTSKYKKQTPASKEKAEKENDSLQHYKKLTDDTIDSFKDDVLKATVDGTGRYKVELPSGFYEIIIVSSNRKGRKLNRFVEIKEDETMDLDFEFGRI